MLHARELLEGSRTVGGQRKRYKETLKVSLNNFDTDPDTWEDLADDRPNWHNVIAKLELLVMKKVV